MSNAKGRTYVLNGLAGKSSVKNDPEPEKCRSCGSPLAESKGYVGEAILYCPDEDCPEGIQWEDQEDVIRRVI